MSLKHFKCFDVVGTLTELSKIFDCDVSLLKQYIDNDMTVEDAVKASRCKTNIEVISFSNDVKESMDIAARNLFYDYHFKVDKFIVDREITDDDLIQELNITLMKVCIENNKYHTAMHFRNKIYNDIRRCYIAYMRYKYRNFIYEPVFDNNKDYYFDGDSEEYLMSNIVTEDICKILKHRLTHDDLEIVYMFYVQDLDPDTIMHEKECDLNHFRKAIGSIYTKLSKKDIKTCVDYYNMFGTMRNDKAAVATERI